MWARQEERREMCVRLEMDQSDGRKRLRREGSLMDAGKDDVLVTGTDKLAAG